MRSSTPKSSKVFVATLIEGQDDDGGNKSQGLEAGLKGDFAYNNNVAGASKHVRLGEFLIVTFVIKGVNNFQWQ